MADSPATATQPDPTGDGAPVLPWVRERIQSAGLIADLEARALLGMERYGTPLRAHNGRDALADLYQEALDAVMYAAQWAMEEPGERGDVMVAESVRFAARIRYRLVRREAERKVGAARG